MTKKNNKQGIISGLWWRFSERILAQVVTLIISIVLARLLEPSDYGMIALVTVFVSILNILITGGFGSALVQKINADSLDFSSVFYFNLIFSIALYIGIFFAAPSISHFYGQNYEGMTNVIRVLALQVIIYGISNVQQAYVSRHMMFKKFFLSTFIGTIISGVMGLGMAFAGFGIWALVAQSLSNPLMGVIVLWFTVEWRPTREFSAKRLKILISFGWKLLCSSLLNEFCNQLRSLIIGKKYSTQDLAYFNKGQQFPSLIVTNINSSIESVLFPAISNVQEDVKSVKKITRKFIKTSSYIMCPIMMGLAIVAEPLVKLILTEKWIFCVPYLQIYCFTYCLMPIQTANLQAIKAIGRTDIYLKLEITKRCISIFLLLSVMKYGVFYIALSLIAESVLCAIINTFPNKKLIDYSYGELFSDISPSLFLSLFMGGIVFWLGNFRMPDILLIVIQIIIGISIYILISRIMKIESYFYIKTLLFSMWKKVRRK